MAETEQKTKLNINF